MLAYVLVRLIRSLSPAEQTSAREARRAQILNRILRVLSVLCGGSAHPTTDTRRGRGRLASAPRPGGGRGEADEVGEARLEGSRGRGSEAASARRRGGWRGPGWATGRRQSDRSRQ